MGLKKGADDYLAKPFNLEELLLRVHKLINKNKKLHDKESIGDTYTFGHNSIDFKAQDAISYDGKKVELSKKEAMLLKLLIENKNEVVTREKILQVVWGYNVYPTTRTIDNFILNFRKYFEEDSRNPVYWPGTARPCAGRLPTQARKNYHRLWPRQWHRHFGAHDCRRIAHGVGPAFYR